VSGPRLRFDHVTAVVGDLPGATAALAGLLGSEPIAELALPGLAIRSFQLGDAELHLVAPTGEGPVADFQRKTGGGFHHLALRVEALDDALASLASRGFRPLGAPVETAPGLREVFLDPATTGGLLLQLVERAAGDHATQLDAAAVAGLVDQGKQPPR